MDNSKQTDEIEESYDDIKILSEEEKIKLNEQNKRLIPVHKAKQLEINAQKYWDLFFKRNETKFLKIVDGQHVNSLIYYQMMKMNEKYY